MRNYYLILCFLAGWLSACTTTSAPMVETPMSSEKPPENLQIQKIENREPVEKPVIPRPVIFEEPKVEQLEYGAEKPLVCQNPIPAVDKLKNRPNMQVMWENYLYDRPEGIWSEIGGKVEVNGTLPFDQGRWTNACAVRLSHMLNKASHKIPRLGDKTVSGGNKDQYLFRLTDLTAYIEEMYGKPDLDITDGTANSWDLPNKAGIVLLDLPNSGYTGHITIWNGAGTVDGSEIGGYRVAFWELPCFIPEERLANTSPQTAAVN